MLTVKGNGPCRALQLIDRLGLYSTIFTDPTAQSSPLADSSEWHAIYKCLEVLESNKTPGSIYQSLVRSDDAKYLAWILTALTPWSAIPNPQPGVAGGKLPLPLATNVAREGFKADNKICSVVTAAFRNCGDVIKLKDSVTREEPFVNERDTLGMMIRKWDSMGGQWKLQVLFALLVDVSRSGDECLGLSQFNMILFSTDGSPDAIFTGWQRLVDHLESLDLMDVVAIRNILDGKRLQKDLNAGPGPWLKEALEVCMAWQLRNAEIVEKDIEEAKCVAIEEVKLRRDDLKIPTKKK
jgi:tRNA nucleotidyltransferase (CCA-adding enzyme)